MTRTRTRTQRAGRPRAATTPGKSHRFHGNSSCPPPDYCSPAEVDAVYAELTGAGYAGHLKPWDAFWGQRYAVVLDPHGCGVSLFAAA